MAISQDQKELRKIRGCQNEQFFRGFHILKQKETNKRKELPEVHGCQKDQIFFRTFQI